MPISAQRRRIFLATYRAARRFRHGLHNPRGKTLNDLRKQYQEEYLRKREMAGPAEQRYRAYVENLQKRNEWVKAETERLRMVNQDRIARLEAEKEEVAREIGYQAASRLYDYQITHDPYWQRLKTKDIPSRYAFDKYVDKFASLDRYIRYRLHKIGSTWWLGDKPLPPQEQYKRKLIYCSVGAPGGADANKRRALKYACGFHAYAKVETEQLAALLKKQKARRPRAHAQQTSSTAKIIVGEKVRHPDSSSWTDQRLHCNDSLVNKVATLLAYFDEHKVSSNEVPALLSQKGSGMEALLKKHRTAKTR